MSEMTPETRPFAQRLVLKIIICALLFVLIAFVILLFLSIIDSLFTIEALYALIAGWVIHGLRVLPDAFGKWQSALLPLASLGVVWWVGHRLMRWWLTARGSGLADAWTARRSAALLGLVLLCAAAAVAISGVAHQMMWLGQTKWTETNLREQTMKRNDIRQLWLQILLFDSEHERLPHSWDELVATGDMFSSQLLQGRSGGHALPILTQPGAELAELSRNSILLISDLVDGRHVVGMMDGSAAAITPEQLDAIIARGDWKYQKEK